MPKRKKKAGTKNMKGSKRKISTSRDMPKSITSPNVSLEQSISGRYEVVWNDKSPLTDQQPVIGRSIMKTLQGKEGLVQKREGHQLLELLKSNMKSVNQQHSTGHISDSELPTKRRQQLEEIVRTQNELKQLAKRLQYYDDEIEEGKDGSPELQQHQQCCSDHSGSLTDVQGTSSATAVTSNITINTTIATSSRPVTRGATKAACSDSGVVESDTDTMSYDDDSSPDHYQPIGSHFSGGVAKDTGSCMASKNGGVAAKTRPSQCVNSNANDFPQLSDAGIILSDDPELDKIFASVEVCILHTHSLAHMQVYRVW